MATKQEISKEQQMLLLQYEAKLREIVGAMFSLAPVYGINITDVRNHVFRIIDEVTKDESK